mmetsp:Transcript_16305/g.29305  ORF Transcript_16305/g.29305 Transcript_16305/m.29305 type:complete len:128 (+) Transcript_16305:177-560(+)
MIDPFLQGKWHHSVCCGYAHWWVVRVKIFADFNPSLMGDLIVRCLLIQGSDVSFESFMMNSVAVVFSVFPFFVLESECLFTQRKKDGFIIFGRRFKCLRVRCGRGLVGGGVPVSVKDETGNKGNLPV